MSLNQNRSIQKNGSKNANAQHKTPTQIEEKRSNEDKYQNVQLKILSEITTEKTFTVIYEVQNQRDQQQYISLQQAIENKKSKQANFTFQQLEMMLYNILVYQLKLLKQNLFMTITSDSVLVNEDFTQVKFTQEPVQLNLIKGWPFFILESNPNYYIYLPKEFIDNMSTSKEAPHCGWFLVKQLTMLFRNLIYLEEFETDSLAREEVIIKQILSKIEKNKLKQQEYDYSHLQNLFLFQLQEAQQSLYLHNFINQLVQSSKSLDNQMKDQITKAFERLNSLNKGSQTEASNQNKQAKTNYIRRKQLNISYQSKIQYFTNTLDQNQQQSNNYPEQDTQDFIIKSYTELKQNQLPANKFNYLHQYQNTIQQYRDKTKISYQNDQEKTLKQFIQQNQQIMKQLKAQYDTKIKKHNRKLIKGLIVQIFMDQEFQNFLTQKYFKFQSDNNKFNLQENQQNIETFKAVYVIQLYQYLKQQIRDFQLNSFMVTALALYLERKGLREFIENKALVISFSAFIIFQLFRNDQLEVHQMYQEITNYGG